MKRFLYILIASVYFFSTTGIIVVTHYCGGEVDSVSLFRIVEEGDQWGCEGSSCCNPNCNDEVKNIKLEVFHTLQSINTQTEVSVLSNDIVFSSDNDAPLTARFCNSHFDSKSPPANSVYILNCTFLI